MLGIYISQGSLTRSNPCSIRARELGPSLAVGYRHRDNAACHVIQPWAGIVFDAHHDHSAFKLLAAIAHEGRPVFGLGNQFTQLG